MARTFLATLAATLAIVFSALTATPALADWSGRDLVNDYSDDQCLDADSNTWNGPVGKVQVWECLKRPGGPVKWNQVWYADWESSATLIRTPGAPVGPAKCLDARRTADPRNPWGVIVSVRTCKGGASSQRWNPTYQGTGQIRHRASGLCLDITLPPSNGSYVGLYECRSRSDLDRFDTQIWTHENTYRS